jgi:transcription antitermination factor NusB
MSTKEHERFADQIITRLEERERTDDDTVQDEELYGRFVEHPTAQRDLRALALNFVYAVDRTDYTLTLDEVVENIKLGFGVEVPHDSFAITLARGAINERNTLDAAIKPLLKNWTFERLGCCTRLILRMAIWEFRNSTASPVVIINESIELAKAFAEKDAYKFINGLLDEYCRIHGLKDDAAKSN